MALGVIDDSLLTNIANTIRKRTDNYDHNGDGTYKVGEFPNYICQVPKWNPSATTTICRDIRLGATGNASKATIHYTSMAMGICSVVSETVTIPTSGSVSLSKWAMPGTVLHITLTDSNRTITKVTADNLGLSFSGKDMSMTISATTSSIILQIT